MSCLPNQAPTPAYQKVNIRGYGHSIAAGADASRQGITDFYSRIARALDPSIFTMTATGHGGYVTGPVADQSVGQLAPLAPTDVDAFIVPGKLNLHLYMECFNSVGYYVSNLGQDQATATANTIAVHQAYFQARLAAGWDAIITYSMFWALHVNTPAEKGAISSVNQYFRTTAISAGYIVDQVDLEASPELNAVPENPIFISPSDHLHPVDPGHQVIENLTVPKILKWYQPKANAKWIQWTPALLSKVHWWVGTEQGGKYVIADASNKVARIVDQSTWQNDFLATGTLRPSWNRVNQSIDFGAGNCATTSLNVTMSATNRIFVLMAYSCSSTGTVVVELGSNATTSSDAWVITNEVGGPKIASYGNVGQSNAMAAVLSGQNDVIFSIDHSVGSNQGNILVEGVPAAGLTRLDAPNNNFFADHPLSIGGRSGGTLSSTMQLRSCVGMADPPSSADIANYLAYIHRWFG